MNIWKDINSDRIKPNDFIACIEIQQGDKTKYELDKETGMLIMDRVLYTSTNYPMNYGFVPFFIVSTLFYQRNQLRGNDT